MNEPLEQVVTKVNLDKDQIINEIRGLAKKSVNLAWMLGAIYKNGDFKKWGYKSFHLWLEDCISNSKDPSRHIISKTYAYTLRDIGVHFFPFKDEINTLLSERKIGIGTLINLVGHIKNGMDIAAATAHLFSGIPLPVIEQEQINAAPAVEVPRQVPIHVRGGDINNFNLSLTLYAILYGNKTKNEALNELVLSELPELLTQFEQNKDLEKYKELIVQDKYYCAHCNQIPRTPTMHHILPQGQFHGYGPQALLCWEPCHQLIQPHWREWAEKWLTKEKTEEYIALYTQMLNNSIDIPNNPQEIITGNG